GSVAAFLSSTGSIHLLGEGLPHRVLIRTADLKDPPPFPWICAVTTKSYIVKKRENVKKVVMSLIEATHFFKTKKRASQKDHGQVLPNSKHCLSGRQLHNHD